MAWEKAWIGVDLDGTLSEYTPYQGWEHIGKPVEPMLNLVKDWVAQGKRVKIFTARAGDGPQAIEAIHSWLVANGLPELEVTNIKDKSMIVLYDDRCVQVETNTGRLMNVKVE